MRWLLTGTLALMLAPAGRTEPQPLPLDQLQPILKNWEQRMNAAQSLNVQCRQTVEDKVWGSRDVNNGQAKFMQPNRASLFLQRAGKPEIFQKYVCDGTAVYEYAPAERVIRKHPLPREVKPLRQGALAFVFGITAVDAQQRFDLELTADEHYYYLVIKPRLAGDRANFSWARVVLNRTTFMPCQIFYTQPNDNTICWDLHYDQAPATAADFAAPTPDKGWTIKEMPTAPE